MKILVFIKQVPETDEIRLDPRTGILNRDSVPSIMNPYDVHAVEAALQLKETHGGSVHVISMGPPQAKAVLKEALAMGCDEAYLLSDRAFGGADSLATGHVLAKAAEKIGGYDLLLFGKCAVDAETAQTGPIVAELLDLPQVTLVEDLACADGWATCRRDLGNQFQTVKVKLPALIAVTGQINRPRYPRPARIRICLDVFDELGLLTLEEHQRLLQVTLTSDGRKVDLDQSGIIQSLKSRTAGE